MVSLVDKGQYMWLLVFLKHQLHWAVMNFSGSPGIWDSQIIYRKTKFWFKGCPSDNQIQLVLESCYDFYLQSCNVWKIMGWNVLMNCKSTIKVHLSGSVVHQPGNIVLQVMTWFLAGQIYFLKRTTSFYTLVVPWLPDENAKLATHLGVQFLLVTPV